MHTLVVAQRLLFVKYTYTSDDYTSNQKGIDGPIIQEVLVSFNAVVDKQYTPLHMGV